MIALILGMETKSLLVGEGANPADHDLIVDAISGGPDVVKLIHIKTLYLGPARGVSNVLTAPVARVRLREGLLLAIHYPGRQS